MWPQYCKLFPSIPLVPKTVSRVHFHPLQHNPCPPNYLFLLLPLSFCPSLPFPELILAFPGVDNLLLLFCFSLQLNYKITQLWSRAEDYREISGWREVENSPRHCHIFLSGECNGKMRIIIRASFAHHLKKHGLTKVNSIPTFSFAESCLIIKMGIPKLPFHLVWMLNEITCTCQVCNVMLGMWSADGNCYGKLTTSYWVVLHASVDHLCILSLLNILSKFKTRLQEKFLNYSEYLLYTYHLYFELWCWRRLLRVPWTARRSNQSILKEISPGCSLQGMMLKLKLQYLVTSCEELTHWKRLWYWEGLGAGGEGDDRGWDDWMASLTRWTCVWVDSRSWWWTGRPGVLQCMGSQRVGHDWATELNWTYSTTYLSIPLCNHQFSLFWIHFKVSCAHQNSSP